jgi:hypothetical protein
MMKGYIYTMSAGADPGQGWVLNDPIFRPVPTLGACVPNIRRQVEMGDWLFVISGRTKVERQYIVGGMRVDEKISHLAALARFPELQVRRDAIGHVRGNIIVSDDGSHHPDDNHEGFERRIENYIVGGDATFLEAPEEVHRGRQESLNVLAKVFNHGGNRPFDIIGRQRRLNEEQVAQLNDWLDQVKSAR